VGKRQVITRFVALSALWLLAWGAIAHWIGGLRGDVIFALSVMAVLTVAWGAFTPNSPVFGRVVGRGRATGPRAAITFDDGPSAEHTPAILDVLAGRGVRATFFVLGRHVRQHPEIVRRIAREGHELASHGEDHSILTFQGPEALAWQLRRLEASVEEATGAPPARLFRAPHGFRSPLLSTVAGRLGYRVVGWTAGVWDTALPGVDRIVSRSVDKLRPGAVLLLHDADGSGMGGDRRQTVEALPAIIDGGLEKGLEFVTVSELDRDLRPHPRMLVRAGLLGIVVGLIVYFVSRTFGLTAIGNVVTTADPALVSAALGANLASVGAKALTWRAAIDAVAKEHDDGWSARLSEVVPAVFIGFLLNTVLFARLGEVARISVLRRKLLARKVDVSVPVLVGTLVTEQLLLAVTLLTVLVAIAGFVSVPGWAVDLIWVLVGVVAAIALAAAALDVWTRYKRRTGAPDDDYVERWWHLLGLNATAISRALNQGQAILRRPRLLALGLGTAAVSWLAQIAGIQWTLHAYGINTGIGVAGLVFLTSTLVGLFPIVPGNLVVFQGATIAALTFATNVSADKALAFSIGLQLIEASLSVGLGFFFLSYEGLSLGELRKEAEASESRTAPS
jgi:peptidoglycan-N-acetylglucosamine deacetylase